MRKKKNLLRKKIVKDPKKIMMKVGQIKRVSKDFFGNAINLRKNQILVVCLSCFFFQSCEDLFLRFKYETYECGKNFFDLKKIFIKNYEVGDLVDVEIDNGGYKLKILENNKDFLLIYRDDPEIKIEINKKTSKLNVNYKNHIQNIKCSKHVFKM